jgi:hypothetical protein
MVLVLLSCGFAAAQTSGMSMPAPASPDGATKSNPHEESIVVPGTRMKAAPIPGTEVAPHSAPQGTVAGTPEPSIMPHSHCDTALQNDVGGQPATSQTLTTTDCQ